MFKNNETSEQIQQVEISNEAVNKYYSLMCESGRNHYYPQINCIINIFKDVLKYFLESKDINKKYEGSDASMKIVIDRIQQLGKEDKLAFEFHLQYLLIHPLMGKKYQVNDDLPSGQHLYKHFKLSIKNFVDEFNDLYETNYSWSVYYELNLAEIWNILKSTKISADSRHLENIIISRFPEFYRFDSDDRTRFSIESTILKIWSRLNIPNSININK